MVPWQGKNDSLLTLPCPPPCAWANLRRRGFASGSRRMHNDDYFTFKSEISVGA